jgi:hypothetical protein
MKRVLPLVAVAVLISFSACEPKPAEETNPNTALDDTTNATDIAETTASPVDTAGLFQDSLPADSVQ